MLYLTRVVFIHSHNVLARGSGDYEGQENQNNAEDEQKRHTMRCCM